MGSQRVRRDWATSLSLFTFMHWRRKWQPIPVFLPGESQGQGSLVGSRLWGRTVGHDWSDLAAAAAADKALVKEKITDCLLCSAPEGRLWGGGPGGNGSSWPGLIYIYMASYGWWELFCPLTHPLPWSLRLTHANAGDPWHCPQLPTTSHCSMQVRAQNDKCWEMISHFGWTWASGWYSCRIIIHSFL